MLHSFLWEKADRNAIKVALIPQTFLILVQNLSERMSFLELLNCSAAEESYRLIMAQYVNKNRKMSSFKSNESNHKKEDGSYYVVAANKASSVTL